MFKNMKKLAIVLMVALLITGCSTKKEPEKGNDDAFTITVWYHPYVGAEKKDDLMKAFAGMETEFKSKYEKATVVFEEIPWADR